MKWSSFFASHQPRSAEIAQQAQRPACRDAKRDRQAVSQAAKQLSGSSAVDASKNLTSRVTTRAYESSPYGQGGVGRKLRGCDLLSLRVNDVCHRNQVAARATVMQRKTQRPVQFEITGPTREAVAAWIGEANLGPEDCLFPNRVRGRPLGCANTPGSWTPGCESWASILAPTEHTQSGERRRHSSIAKPETCGCSVVTRLHKTGEYSSLPRDRSR